MNFRILAVSVGPRARLIALLAATALAVPFAVSDAKAQAPAPGAPAAPKKAAPPKAAPKAPAAPAAQAPAGSLRPPRHRLRPSRVAPPRSRRTSRCS